MSSKDHGRLGTLWLSLAAVQSTLPLAFASRPWMRHVHAYLGTSLVALFLLQACYGVKLYKARRLPFASRPQTLCFSWVARLHLHAFLTHISRAS